MRALVIALLVALAAGHAAADAHAVELVVIVHPDNPAKPSSGALEDYFERKERQWGDDTQVIPINAPPGSDARREFDKVVLGMTPEVSARFWLDVRIRSGDSAPKELADPALVVRLVGKLRGAVAYVPAATNLTGVRVVARVRGGKLGPP